MSKKNFDCGKQELSTTDKKCEKQCAGCKKEQKYLEKKFKKQ